MNTYTVRGQRVSFELEKGERGLHASQVTVHSETLEEVSA